MENDEKQGKSSRTRQFIIEQVAPVFNKKGYTGTSLTDMTQACGLTKGALYGNFKNKDQVAIEAFRHNLSLISDAFRDEMYQWETPSDKLLAFVKVYRKIYPQIIERGGCPILNTACDADDTHPELRQMSLDVLLRQREWIEKLIAEGIHEGEISNSARPRQTAVQILALLEGGLMLAKLSDEETYFETSLRQIEKMIREMLI